MGGRCREVALVEMWLFSWGSIVLIVKLYFYFCPHTLKMELEVTRIKLYLRAIRYVFFPLL